MLTSRESRIVSLIPVLSRAAQSRFLNLHEYQSKDLLDKFGVPTQIGYTASTPREAREGVRTVVLKAQIFAGGRGKGHLTSGLQGGVQFSKEPEDVERLAKKMLGFHLITHQTGPEGLLVNKILLAEGVSIEREFYLAIVLDRSKGGPVIVASREGGVDIEDVAESKPEAIAVEPVDILKGISDENLEAVVHTLLPDVAGSIPPTAAHLSPFKRAEMHRDLQSQLKDLIRRLYSVFEKSDAAQIEINPLAITSDNRILCVDAKLNFDDNAAFRQKDLFAQEDTSTRDKRELGAEEMHMNFVAMDGDIGCLVNGAGLAMATMDLIAHNGRSPANFLDLGGGATKEQVLRSFELLNSDPKVHAIFVNIFGGITRCDVVAQGILESAREMNLSRPLVVRLVGNNAEKAREIINSPALAKTGLNITYIQDFAEAAAKVCELAERSN